MGGAAHPQINAMSLVRAFDLGLGPLEAVSAPRWLAGGMDPVQPDAFVEAEAGAARAVRGALESSGFRVDELPERSEAVGHAQLLLVGSDGTFAVAADPRSDGGAAAR